MKNLSLCMIVRDEEAMLGRCLESVRGVVDEVVVVDTGSRDRSIELARSHGARVVEFPWCDDFAAARNAGLEVAQGKAILWLDADEALAPGAGETILRPLASQPLLLGNLPLLDASRLDATAAEVVSGEALLRPAVYLPRVFLNSPHVRFRRRVHETIGPCLARARELVGGHILPVEAPIVHWGNVPELRRTRGKDDRNRKLIERVLADDPEDGDMAGYYAGVLFTEGDLDGVLALGERTLPGFFARLRRSKDLRLEPSPVPLATHVTAVHVLRGDADAALRVTAGATPVCCEPHPNLIFLEGVALEMRGEYALAEERFRACLALADQRFVVPLNPGVTGDAARLRLSNVLLAQGRPAEALEFAGVIELPELACAAALSCAEAELDLGRPKDALEALVPLLDRGLAAPDLFILASDAASALGVPDPAFTRAARELADRPWFDGRRKQRLGP